MKKIAIALFVAGAASVAQAQAPKPPPWVAQDAADGAFTGRPVFGETSGEKMYRRVCAACHMADGKGAEGAGRYPALANNPNLAAGAYSATVVLKGLNGMPPIGNMMTDQQVADVVNYISTHMGNKHDVAMTAAEVKAIREIN